MSVITPKNKLSQNEYHAKHGLKKLAKNSLYISLIFGQVLWPVSNAMAAPVFIPGDGVKQTGSNEYTVTDNRAIAQWQSFVLDETETIKFLNQDGIENSILLNLVTSEIGSKIAGELNAKNIQFILVDPSGISIADSAKIDVSGLVLSTIDVTGKAQKDFKKTGNLFFDSSSNGKIIIDSDATLVPSNLENVVLIGKNIQNDANIKASGLVAMLATDNATLNLSGSNILGVSFDASKLISDIKFINNGSIEADKVFLATLAANQAININKNITANQIVISGDKIQLASNITKNNENGLLKIGKLSSENASIDINLDAASELTIGSNSALSGFDDSQISVKANTVNVESETYTKATIKNNNKITLGGFTDITAVQLVSFTNNQNNGISTNSSALLTGTENSLTTRGVTFSGISNANLGGNSLTGSSATDSFVITSEGITANDIAVKNLNTTIDANGNAELSGADNNTWTITADKVLKEGGVGSVGGYVFTGLDQVAFAENAAVLYGRGSDTFEFQSGGLLEAASMNFETAHLKQVNNTHELITNADASLQSTNGGAIEKSLETHGIVFTGVNTAKLDGNTLIGSSATDSFEITSQGIKANGIAVEDLNTTIKANGDAVLSGADDNTWTITADNTLKEGGVGSVGGYVFTGLDQVAFAKDEAVLNGRGSDTFTFKDDGLLNDGLLDAASMNFETAHLKQVNNTHELITNADASLQSTNGGAIEKSLKTNGVIFTGVNTADLGGKLLTGSSATDSFVITSEGITANDIAVKNLNTKIKANGDAVLSGEDDNTWTITADNTLKEGGVGSVGGYVFTGLDQVAFAKDEAVLNGRGSDTFTFKDDGLLNDGLLDAASMNFETAHLKQVNNTHELITNADASLQSTNGGAIEKSLKTNGVIFTGVNTADLGGKLLTGSSATDSFEITSQGIKANDIAVKNLNTKIKANGDAVLSGEDDNTWTIAADNTLKEGGVGSVGGYVFTGLGQVAFAKDEAVLNGRGSDTFEFQSGGLLEAASMNFETAHLKQVNNTHELITNADASLQSTNGGAIEKSLKTNGVIFTGVNTADLGGKLLTGSSATDSFVITSEGITANDIAVEDLNTTIRANGKASLLGAEDDTWLLTGVSGELKSQATDGYTFTGLTEADLNNESLKGSSGSDRFNIINGDLQANNILITNLKNNTVNANGSAILSGAEDSIWLLTDSLGTLQYKATGGYTFTDLTAANLSNEGLKGSVEHNRFTVIGNKKLDAAGIEFTGVTSVVGSSNLGHVVANDEVKLGKKGHELTTQNISISGIGSVDLNRNILTATNANQNSFTVTGTNTLTAADINFKQVSNVFGYNKQGHVNANAAATLSKDNALSTQGIEFSDIGSMDLGGQTLIGSKSHDSFKIHTNGSGVNANGIEIVNLDRTINVNGAASLSGAQNNTWQLTNTTNTLEDSRDNGFVFVGVNDANLQGGVLSGSAVQNKYEIIDTQKLVAAAMTFTGVSKVNGHNKSGYLVTNATTQLMDAENQLQTQRVILSGIGQAHLKGNVLKGSATGSTLELISESRVDASGIKFFDFGELDGNENTGALVSKLDAPQWTMTTANPETVNNVKFKGFKTLKNSVGDLKLITDRAAEFDGASVSFGGNTSLEFNERKNVTIAALEQSVNGKITKSKHNINGQIIANELNIDTGGDVDLKTQVK